MQQQKYFKTQENRIKIYLPQNRDWQDLRNIYTCIKERNPFQIEGQLINISNGMHAHATFNVELAIDVGMKILNDMNGRTPANHSFKKKDQAITLAVKSSVKVQDDKLQVDPDLLFQRLASFAAKIA